MRIAVFLLLLCCSLVQPAVAAQARPPMKKHDCAIIEGMAEAIYMRIREARLYASEVIARERSLHFWDIVERGGAACPRLQRMSTELDRTGLSRQYALGASGIQDPPVSSQRFSGGSDRGAATGSGDFAPVTSPSGRPPRPLRSSTGQWDGVTTGATQSDRSGDSAMGASGASGATGTSGSSGASDAARDLSDTGDPFSPGAQDRDTGQQLRAVPRPVCEL